MNGHRLKAEMKLAGDRVIVVTLSDQVENLKLTVAQLINRR